MKNLDIVICIVPKIQPDAPTVGPAILKSHLESAGFTCEVYDFNVKLYNFLKTKNTHIRHYFDDDSLFASIENNVSEIFENFYNENKEVFDTFLDFLKTRQPKWVGLSLLSDYSKSAALKLSELIRRDLPDTKIVWGGTQIAKKTREVKKLGFCDHYIIGDGEHAIVNLLNEKYDTEGIDELGPTQLYNLNEVLLPNYDDIAWDEYEEHGFTNSVYITGSRGCVKDCVFCSVNELWPKYVYRTHESIASEIDHLQKRYNRSTFRFTDSLVNGSMKTYTNLIDNFVDFKKDNPNFEWTGQWIIRNQRQLNESHYVKLGNSGIKALEMGVESFSQPVRYHMGKKFTNDELWWCLEMLRKYNIPQSLLMISGYPTETEVDHEITMRGLDELHTRGFIWGDSGDQIMTLNFTSMLLDKWTAEKFNDGMEYYNDYRDWKYLDNDRAVRIKRYTEIVNKIEEITKQEIDWRTKKDLKRYKK